MTREIKFRAWDKHQKEILDVLAIRDEEGNIVMQRMSQPKTVIRNKPENVDLMQYTGLKDKNGKEIYEGDIVDWKGKIEVVEWYARGCWYPFIYVEGGVNEHLDQAFSSDMEIIGNIHEK